MCAAVFDQAADPLAASIRAHVEALCAAGDRHPGTQRNRDATAYVAAQLAGFGAQVEQLEFEVGDWRYGEAWIEVGGRAFSAFPGPFSVAAHGEGVLLAASSPTGLEGLDARGCVLLLHGEIAAAQLTPRGYPWYSNPDDERIAHALEAAAPLAIVAATGINPETTGAQSPFPLIEEVGFGVPTAFLDEPAGEWLCQQVGKIARVRIDSRVEPSTGVQVVGRTAGEQGGRILVGAHVDTKPDTPGALDNAAGVATLLAVAQMLRDTPTRFSVEYLPFNGEDHVASPGEVAYLETYPDLTDVRLMVNVDDAGLAGGVTEVSEYGLDDATRELMRTVMAEFDLVREGPQWPASDHMIFAMRGVPALALTASDLTRVMGEISHTPRDTPDLVDEVQLAQAARFIARFIEVL